MLTEQERAELSLLSLANESGKFALDMTAVLPGNLSADAFNRGLNEDWFRLLDVCPVPTGTGSWTKVMRIFRLTEKGIHEKAKRRDHDAREAAEAGRLEEERKRASQR